MRLYFVDRESTCEINKACLVYKVSADKHVM